MDLMKAVAIVITGILALAVINGQMLVTPWFQAGINVVFVGKNQAAQLNGLCLLLSLLKSGTSVELM